MNFDANRYVQDIDQIIRADATSELPAFGGDHAFAVVNKMGILHLISKLRRIFRKQHLRNNMESTSLTPNMLTELLPTPALFNPVLLVGNLARVDFSYCYKFAETMDKSADFEAPADNPPIRPVFIASPFCLWYGDFVENTRAIYPETSITLGSRIRHDSDLASGFEIKAGDEVVIYGTVALRITGSKRYLHVTKAKFGDDIVRFEPADPRRKLAFDAWLQSQAFLHGHVKTLPTKSDGRADLVVNPMIDIPFN